MIYISISIPPTKGAKQKDGIAMRILIWMISLIIPEANPDYDKDIPSVSTWLLEFKDEDSIPDREIGMDVTGRVTMKMPFKNNYGYWTDNNLRPADFAKHFGFDEIKESFFEEKWKGLS